jgi:hypothetical protein
MTARKPPVRKGKLLPTFAFREVCAGSRREKRGHPHRVRRNSILTQETVIVWGEPVLSALLFAREYLSRISTPAFLYAAFATVELLSRDQTAGPTGITAVCILATLITKLVVYGTDLRGIWPAREVETVAIGEPAGERCRSSRRDRRRYRRDCTALLGRCTTCDKYGEYGHAHC